MQTRTPEIISRLICAAGAALVLNSCSPEKPPLMQKTPIPVPTLTPTQSPAALPFMRSTLIPRKVTEGAEMLLYRQGAVVNETAGINLLVQLEDLQQINIDPGFGINLKADEQNVTFLVPHSIADNTERSQKALTQVQAEAPMVLSALNRSLGINRGRLRFSVISVADVLKQAAGRHPGLSTKSALYQEAVNMELASAYLALTKAKIFNAPDTPIAYPEISESLRKRLSGIRPFTVLSIDPLYLAELKLSDPI